ncbi:hypothetical protein [Streptococcus cristatus]|jgi:hypothetical protein|uniref:hypothetical protein n=1 Tax=Streptococcus cristatus TaxID=45634 RepID=UPI0011F372A8|nr:hypothetical protein [Streptococcus cristatus]
MSNNQKKIDSDNLSRVNGAFKDMSAELQNNASDLIDSSATEQIQNATDELKKLSKEMVATISSLDEYLGAVGEAFRNADANMAQSIGQNMYTKAPESRAERRERYIQGGKDSQERHNRRKMADIAEGRYHDFP